MASETMARAQVMHASPGRLRIRFEKGVNIDEMASRLETALADALGVTSVQPRPVARSVLITFDPSVAEAPEVLDRGLSTAAIELTGEPSTAPSGRPGGTAVGNSVVDVFRRANGRLGVTTGGFLDLRDVFPLTLFGFGLRRVAQGQLQPIPWYNLLYYGYSTFAALHARRGGSQAEPDAREILRRRYARGEITRRQLRGMLEELANSR
ncbi:MAG: hypothetical protein M0Z94_14925 [Dehalococcoidales bacterium]|nr:hypothetical protein [Dehalococcoidales bacterium]